MVLGRGSFGNDLGGEVGQQYDLGLQGVGRLLHLGRQFYRFFFERRHFGLFRFGFVAFALPHQRADHLGRLVLLRQTVIQLLLDRLAAVVELLDPVDDGRASTPFLARRRTAASLSSRSCLSVSIVNYR